MKVKSKKVKVKNNSRLAVGVMFSLLTVHSLPLTVSAQTGGNYAITQSVIASGGGQNSSGGTFAVAGTIGQTIAGQTTNGAPFTVNAGFWNPVDLVPTAALVEVGGRVTTANGQGIRNVGITLTDAAGNTRTTVSSAFGNFTFADVAVGEIYVFTVNAKRYSFAQNAQVRSINEAVSDLFFIADDQ